MSIGTRYFARISTPAPGSSDEAGGVLLSVVRRPAHAQQPSLRVIDFCATSTETVRWSRLRSHLPSAQPPGLMLEALEQEVDEYTDLGDALRTRGEHGEDRGPLCHVLADEKLD